MASAIITLNKLLKILKEIDEITSAGGASNSGILPKNNSVKVENLLQEAHSLSYELSTSKRKLDNNVQRLVDGIFHSMAILVKLRHFGDLLKAKDVENDCGSGSQPSASDKADDVIKSDRRAAIEATIVKFCSKERLSFQDVAGLHSAKTALHEAIVMPLQFPQLFTGKRQPWRSVLLYGPPGTGKSRLAMAVAGETGALFYNISSADLVSVWHGESEKLVRELFDHALGQEGPVVIFIDEIDSLCRTRTAREDESTRHVKTELLIQMQRIQASDRGSVYLLCATNCPQEIDPAFLRRFQKRIYILLPDFDARVKILKDCCDEHAELREHEWKELGRRTDGMSGDDLHTLAQDALYAPLRELSASGGTAELSPTNMPPTVRKVVFNDLVKALGRVFPTVTVESLQIFEDFTRKFGAKNC